MNLIENYYNSIKHFRGSLHYLKEIEEIEDAIIFYEQETAQNVIMFYADKYKTYLNKIGKLLTDVYVYKDITIYNTKTDEDLINDLHYLIDSIIIIATVNLGLEKSLNEIIVKLKNEKE